MNGIYTPDFLEEIDGIPDRVEHDDVAENDSSLANISTVSAATKRKKSNSELNTE